MFDCFEREGADQFSEHLVENCSKLRLLKKINDKGEQILVFSNFKSFTDIFEYYCTMREYKFCRLDGQTELEDIH
jgi:SWI/SNF-related matrix-associated actin-dependent regulator of chromatin subfamily A member 5